MLLKACTLLFFVFTLAAVAVPGQPSYTVNKQIAANHRARSSGVERGALASIKIVKHDTESEWIEKTFYGMDASVFNLDLALGESIENQIIVLQAVTGDNRAFKIEQQFETSLAIGDEGPHLDLVNWKHYTSDWTEIERLDDSRFLTVKVHESDTVRFPTVTTQEIQKVALKEGGRRWGNLARQCKNLVDGPCYVGMSRISFRISANENGNWREIHRINASIPLGC